MARKYDSKSFATKVEEFEQAINSGTIEVPTDYAMCKFFEISISTLRKYMDEGCSNIKNPYYNACKKLIALREDYYVRLGITSKNPSFAIYALKQKNNGGWTDKEKTEDKAIKLEVTVNGCKNPFG